MWEYYQRRKQSLVGAASVGGGFGGESWTKANRSRSILPPNTTVSSPTTAQTKYSALESGSNSAVIVSPSSVIAVGLGVTKAAAVTLEIRPVVVSSSLLWTPTETPTDPFCSSGSSLDPHCSSSSFADTAGANRDCSYFVAKEQPEESFLFTNNKRDSFFVKRSNNMWQSLLGGGGGASFEATSPRLEDDEEGLDEENEDGLVANDDGEQYQPLIGNSSTATAAAAATDSSNVDPPEIENDDEDEDDSDDDHATTTSSRFGYMTRIATRFIETVSASEDQGDNDDVEYVDDEYEDDRRLADESENAWIDGDDYIDLSTSERHEHTQSDTIVAATSAAPQIVVEASENAWEEEEEDDLDLSTSGQQQPGKSVPDNNNSASNNNNIEGAPVDGSKGESDLEQSEREVADRLDSVLQQIQEQEHGQTTALTSTVHVLHPPISLDSDDDDDDHHCDEAVHRIQQELDFLSKNKNSINSAHPSRDDVNRGTATPLVDVTPQNAMMATTPALYNNNHDVGDDELTRDTGFAAATGDAHESLVADDDEDNVYEDENEEDYGLVVDHTPTKAIPLARVGSMAVHAGQLERDFREDAALSVSESGWNDDDDLLLDGATISEENGLPQKANPESLVESNWVVDHTPVSGRDTADILNRSLSVGVLASMGDTVDVEQDDEKEMNENHEFGPVVDLTPQAPSEQRSAVGTDFSLAVNAAEIEEDFAEDEAMDYTCYGDSTVGGLLTEYPDDDDGNNSRVGGWASDDEDDGALTTTTDDDDVDNQKMPPLVSMEPKRATFSPTLATFANHVVDHTPCELDDSGNAEVVDTKRDPSIIALAMSEDETRDAGVEGIDEEVYDDENEHEYGLVVDQTPQTPLISLASSGANSLAVHASALKQDIEDDEAMDDTSYNGSTLGDGETDAADWVENDEHDQKISAQEPTLGSECTVTLVDHTPSEIDSPSKFIRRGGPSVVALASVANTVETGEADSTGEVHVAYGPVVDQTPTTPALDSHFLSRRSDSIVDSVVVQGKDDVDSVDETTVMGGSRIDYGDDTVAEVEVQVEINENPVVDFLPPHSGSRHGDGSTLVAADPSEVLSEGDDLVPDEQIYGPVVDLTPLTHEGPIIFEQPSGEGSTVVFAPPSVAVDDLDPEDEGDVAPDQEGWNIEDPVVDQEPNPQSGNDEPAPINRANEQLVDFLPPPNDEIVMIGDAAREALSEMTVGGAQSLLPGGDPVEDDFGPVVDQLPSVDRSHASTSTQLSNSECRAMEKDDRVNEGDDASSVQAKAKVLVDHLPVMDRKRQIYSNATMGQSQFSEEEEEEDACKFGPVVDHLPTSRASIAPSRGGSTVDALATVSEGTSDDADDGWDDDADFDASLGGVSEITDRQGVSSALSRLTSTMSGTPALDADRSVRFDSSANDSRSIGDSAGLGFKRMQAYDKDIETAVPTESQYNDPELLKASETPYFDPNQASEVDWKNVLTNHGVPVQFREFRNTEMTDKSFAEADTPPSTPYRRHVADTVFETQVVDAGDMSLPLLYQPRCEQCSSSQCADCPCVQRLVAVIGKSGCVVGSMMTPEGQTLQIDITQMLQDEVTRRRLVEEELKALRVNLGNNELNELLIKARVAELENDMSEKHQLKDRAMAQLLESQNDHVALRGENEKLLDEIRSSRSSVKELEKSQASFIAKEVSFQAEVQSLKMALSRSCSNGDGNERNATLEIKYASKSAERIELLEKVGQLEAQLCNTSESFSQQSKEATDLSDLLQRSVASLKDQLFASDSLAKSTENARREVERKLLILETEITSLRAASVQIGSLRVQHEADLQTQYRLQDKKSLELRALEDLVTSLNAEKSRMISDLAQQRSLAEQSESLANELVAVAKERDFLEQALTESKNAMESYQTLIDTVTTENGGHESRFHELRGALHESEAVAEIARNNSLNEKAQLSLNEHEIMSLKQELEHVLGEQESLTARLSEATAEIDTLSKSLQRMDSDSKEQICRAQEQRAEYSRAQALSEKLKMERDTVASERDAATMLCKSIETEYSNALLSFELKAQQLSTDHNRDVSDLKLESDKLREEVNRLNEAEANHAKALDEVKQNAQTDSWRYEEQMTRLSNERDNLAGEIARLEVLNSQTVDSHVKRDDLLVELESLRDESNRRQSLLESAEHERDVIRDNLAEHVRQQSQESSNAVLQNEQLQSEMERLQGNELLLIKAAAEQKQQFSEASMIFEKEISRLQTEGDELRVQSLQLCSEAEALRQELGQFSLIQVEYETIREENEELLVQFGLQKQRLDASESTVIALRLDMEAMTTTFESALNANLDALRASNTDLLSQVESIAAQRDASDVERQRMEVDSRERVNSLNAQIHELEQQTSELRDQVEQQVESINRLNQEIANTAIVKEQLDVLTMEVDQKTQVILGYESDIRSLQDELGRVLDREGIALSKANELEIQCRDSNAQHASIVGGLEHRLVDLEAQLQRSTNAMTATELTRAAQEQSAQIAEASATARIEQIEAALQLSKQQNDEAAAVERSTWHEQIAVLNQSLQSTRAHLESKENEVDRLNVLLSELHQQQQQEVLNNDVNDNDAIVMAQALAMQRSPQDRAEAMQRLGLERSNIQQALSRLSALVQKFASPPSGG